MSLKRPAKVIIVGTAHPLQLGKEGADVADKFEAFLREICDNYGIRAIAEEMNPQAMEEGGATSTLGMKVAAERCLPHAHCDPNRYERKALGIRQDNDVLLDGFFTARPEQESRALIAVEYSKREAIWLDRLRGLDTWPTLFVCGANHVESFSSLLASNNIATVNAASDWPQK